MTIKTSKIWLNKNFLTGIMIHMCTGNFQHKSYIFTKDWKKIKVAIWKTTYGKDHVWIFLMQTAVCKRQPRIGATMLWCVDVMFNSCIVYDRWNDMIGALSRLH